MVCNNQRIEKSGEGGIRTLGRISPTPVFETGPIGRSGTSPVDFTSCRIESYGISLIRSRVNCRFRLPDSIREVPMPRQSKLRKKKVGKTTYWYTETGGETYFGNVDSVPYSEAKNQFI